MRRATAIANERFVPFASEKRVPRKSSRFIRNFVRIAAITCLAFALLCFLPIYDDSLRDARYLDGWLLAAGMLGQLSYHVAIKAGASPKLVMPWRVFHLFLGYLLVTVFLSHCRFSFPDTALEWALWVAFVTLNVSGAAAGFLTWSVRWRYEAESRVGLERIPQRSAELERELQTTIIAEHSASLDLGLPPAPYDAWILDLYAQQVRPFFQKRNFAWSHPSIWSGTLKHLIEDIEAMSHYVDENAKAKLATITKIITEKDRLDHVQQRLWLSRCLMYLHVSSTYSVGVLVLAHVVIVYSFASGGW